MFIQVIQGQVQDPAGLRAQFERWHRELAPDAPGWLGTTAGLPTQGGFVAVVRFESAGQAVTNNGRPEQDQWWTGTARLLDGVVFHDCPTVDLIHEGGADDAGFVQVIQGTTNDPGQLREAGMRFEERLRTVRPELLGGTIAWHDDGVGFTQTMYFTNEAEAREGERRELPADMAAELDDVFDLIEDVSYLDLTEPWLWSRRPRVG